MQLSYDIERPEKKAGYNDFITQVIKHAREEKLPAINKLVDGITTVEERTGKSIREHLAFGDLLDHKQLRMKTFSGGVYFGEVDLNNKKHGRGILIQNLGHIYIQNFLDDDPAAGNYIYVHSDGRCKVGERYFKDEVKYIKGTYYKTDGTNENYDAP